MGSTVRLALGLVALTLAAWPPAVAAQGSPRVRIESPAEGATVTGPKVDVRVRFDNFKTVDAGTPVKAGEGHAHVYIDREAFPAAQAVPVDQPNIVHMGKAPYDSRQLDLQPGRHTLTVQLADSSHKTLEAATTKVSFTVAAAGGSPPGRAADTGDGSLAGETGVPLPLVLALAVGGLALAVRLGRTRL